MIQEPQNKHQISEKQPTQTPSPQVDKLIALEHSQTSLKTILRQYQNLHNQLAVRSKIGYDNNQNILTIFIKIASVSFKPIQLLLRFMSDADLLSVAASCQTIYKMMYSPLGYRIVRWLRPVVVRVKRQRQMPVFNKGYLQNLCNDVNMVNMDQDDKLAIIQTMKTNLMAARQKMRQIDLCNEQWQQRKTILKSQMLKIGHQRQQNLKSIDQIYQQKQKLVELLNESSGNIARLKQSQEKMLEEREKRKAQLQIQKSKLERQKELLIKKIRAQQKQREEGLIYAREVSRITTMLNKLTKK